MSRILLFASGVFGAAGVTLSALAAHRGGGTLATAAAMLLAHAPALLAVGLHGGARAPSSRLGISAALMTAGLMLFCGDLAAREFLGSRLFPMAAPAGGLLLIAGWMTIAVSAVPDR